MFSSYRKRILERNVAMKSHLYKALSDSLDMAVNLYCPVDGTVTPIVAKAVKPLPPAFLMALRKLGAKRSETVVIGDQLVTDVMGAHFLGMKAYLLAPLVEQDLPHTLLLRNFERVVMGERKPEGAASTSQNAVPCEDEEPDAQGV